jgi:hypothetical protein
MDEMKYALLTEVIGNYKAEIIQNFLQTEGIDVVLIQDSLSQSTYFNPFATVQIFVPKEEVQQASGLLKEFEDKFENDRNEEEDEE